MAHCRGTATLPAFGPNRVSEAPLISLRPLYARRRPLRAKAPSPRGFTPKKLEELDLAYPGSSGGLRSGPYLELIKTPGWFMRLYFLVPSSLVVYHHPS